MARAEGLDYADLINEILNLALDRHQQEGETRRRTDELFQRSMVRPVASTWDGL
jgi:hypothetical protein